MTRLPLEGRRVLVTRAAHQAPELSRLIRDLGGVPVEVPLIAIVAPEDWSSLDQALRRLDTYHWLVFTSRNAVTWTLDRAGQLGVQVPPDVRVAAVGHGTESALRARRLTVHLVPQEARWQGLVAALAERARPGDRILLPRSARAGEELPQALRALGLHVDDVPVYRTVAATGAAGALRRALGEGVDALVFTSASTIDEFMAALGADEARRLLAAGGPAPRPLVACIGPNTAEHARALGLPVDVVPPQTGVEPLVDALAGALAGPGGV